MVVKDEDDDGSGTADGVFTRRRTWQDHGLTNAAVHWRTSSRRRRGDLGIVIFGVYNNWEAFKHHLIRLARVYVPSRSFSWS